MQKQTPFNISLLNLNVNNIYKHLPVVTSGNMFDGANYHLHPNGLWSNEIFGPMGSPKRMTQQAYINLNITVIHPVIYRELCSASSLLDEIMAGETYAKFNEETKFFERSNAIDGSTGYEFFISHVDKLELPSTGSRKRNEAIKLLNKHKAIMMLDKWLVLQAGYRDVEFNDGQISHDEINNIYREIISLANSVSSVNSKLNMSMVNNTRYALQKAVLKLYMHIGDITGNGKKKVIQNKWSSRTVASGTANVMTATRPGGRFIGDKKNLGYMDSMMGLFQALVLCGPFSVKSIKESFLEDVFPSPLEPARLVNKKTWKTEEVTVAGEWHSLFQSDEGIRKLIQRYRPTAIRHKYVEIEGRYLALIWKGEIDGKKCFKVIHGINEIPDGFSKDDVYPITFTELLYICIYHVANGKPSNTVRYPITGMESNVPARLNIHTTVKDERRYILNDDWQIDEFKEPYHRFPITGEDHVTSSAPPVTAIAGLGAD